MEKVTLYNHRHIGDKDIIPNAEFKRLVELLDEAIKIAEMYDMVYAQKSLIKSLKSKIEDA